MPGQCEGIYAAILTPLMVDGSIDTHGLAALCADLLANGCNGIALFGTTGEAPCFSLEEREQALEAILRLGVPAEKLIVGTGCCAVPETVRLTRHAVCKGCAGVLMLPPFYYKDVSDAGLYDAYARAVERVADDRLRLYLYHFPDMSGVPLSRDLVARLNTNFPEHIVGIKDSSGNLENMAALVETLPGLTVFTGDDDLLLPLMKKGGHGSITAGANIASPLLAEIYAEWRTESEQVKESHAMLKCLWSDLLLQFPVTEALKELLAVKTNDEAWLRMRPPLTRLRESQRRSFLGQFAATGFEIRESLKDVLANN